MMKILLILLIISGSVNASNIDNSLTIFNQNYLEHAQGIVDYQDITFLVARQSCLTQKKYAGTKEQKLATATIMSLFSRYVAQKNLALELDDIPYQGQFRQDIFEQIIRNVSLQSQQYQSSSKKIIDRDTGQCERLIVYVLPSIEKSVRDEEAIVAAINNATATVLNHMVNMKDSKRLAEWISQLEFDELTAAMSEQAAVKHETTSDTKVPDDFDKSQLYNRNLDPQLVIYKALTHKTVKQSGEVPAEYQRFALSLTVSAQKLFDQGEKPDLIFRKLSLSLNIDPNQYQAWYLLGSLYRAFDNPSFAMLAQHQSIIANPWFSDSWIELAKSKKMITPAFKLTSFYQHLNQLPADMISSWGKKQIKQSL